MGERKSSPFTKHVEVFDTSKINCGDIIELRAMEGHMAPREVVRRGAITAVKEDYIVMTYVNAGGTLLNITVNMNQLNEDDELKRVDMKILFKIGEK